MRERSKPVDKSVKGKIYAETASMLAQEMRHAISALKCAQAWMNRAEALQREAASELELRRAIVADIRARLGRTPNQDLPVDKSVDK